MRASGALQSPDIIDAFGSVDRADFVGDQTDAEIVYGDHPLAIGQGQTISQPSTVAFMLELLQPRSGDKILDVGSGSGWTTALLAQIVGEGGFVDGVEIVPELAERGEYNLTKYTFPWAQIHHVKAWGLPQKAPFDKILVSAAGTTMPQALIDQLREGGRLVVPILNEIVVATKQGKECVRVGEYTGFSFVPLIEP